MSLGIKDPFVRIIAWLVGCGVTSACLALSPFVGVAVIVVFLAAVVRNAAT